MVNYGVLLDKVGLIGKEQCEFVIGVGIPSVYDFKS